MKEQIYSIPVNEAFEANTECPFCYMWNKLDEEAVNFMMGPSYMEDDIRMDTNKIGFCKEHYQKMYKQQNRLGLALMLQTHFQKLNKDLVKLLPESGSPSIPKKNIFSKAIITSNSVSGYIHNVDKQCYICNKIDNTYGRFIDTFFYLWKKDTNFVKLVKESKGFCLNHFADIYDATPNKLSANDCADFYKVIIPIEIENLKRVEDELSWFINKFDYRYANEPWKNSKDALPRSIEKVASTLVE